MTRFRAEPAQLRPHKPNALLLDTNFLGRFTHPKNSEARAWLDRWMRGAPKGFRLYLSSLVDYELRRILLRSGAVVGLASLDKLMLGTPPFAVLSVLDVDLRFASTLWGQGVTYRTLPSEPGLPPSFARRRAPSRSSRQDIESLGADAIIAAQALRVGASVLTANVRDFVDLCPVVEYPVCPRPNPASRRASRRAPARIPSRI